MQLPKPRPGVERRAVLCHTKESNMNKIDKAPEWIIGWHTSGIGFIPVISTLLTFQDRLGGFRARWGIGRMSYKVNPGLYAVGAPDADSPVLVTANYKLTFDNLRKNLRHIKAWVIVLDTKGINVWCAAGKGTFGTEELVRQIRAANLFSTVRHRTLILPQLGAPGVAAYEVTRITGFKVVYGPVRASDLPRFLENGLKADRTMRTVSFDLIERLAVVPVELVKSWKIVLAAFLFVFLSRYPAGDMISLSTLFRFLPYVCAILIGCLFVPALLPWVPGPSLAFKGWFMCIIAVTIYAFSNSNQLTENIVYLLILPAISSFLAFNYTGATPYTSLSGVKKEMKFAMPLIGFTGLSGIALHLINLWRTT
jgi:hypothetical protein